MKSHIFGMFSVCALTIGLMSCSSNEDTEAPANDVLTQNVEKYGTRSSEVSLQFGASKIAATRAADVNGNMWGDIMPAYPTEEEKQGVLSYVRNNPGATVEWPGYTYYFVQDVIGAHNKYSYTDRNGAQHSDIDGTSHLDLLEVLEANRTLQPWEKDDKGNPYSWVDLYTHVNNFNNGQCNNAATHNATLMTEGFKDARAHDSYGNTWVDDWRLYYWNGNYYLGLDYKMAKDDGKIDPDGIYDDWIVKILPGKGETPVKPADPSDPSDPETPSTPSTPETPSTLAGEVEFDIHQQEHKDWNEIKTSIHVRDTAAVHVFLPIPIESQAVADDFHIRGGQNYDPQTITYPEQFNATFEFAGQKFNFPVEIKHEAAGIDILIDCTTDEAKAALKLARGVFADGITFEIHSYVNPDVNPDQIWNWLKTVKLPSTKTSQWPEEGDICTHVHGQVSSAYHMDEMIKFDQRP